MLDSDSSQMLISKPEDYDADEPAWGGRIEIRKFDEDGGWRGVGEVRLPVYSRAALVVWPCVILKFRIVRNFQDYRALIRVRGVLKMI